MSQLFSIMLFISINCNTVLTSQYFFYEVTAFNLQERDLLHEIENELDYTYFFNGVTNEAATFMNVAVDSCCTKHFEGELLKHDIEYSCVTSQDLFPMNSTIKGNLRQRSVIQSFLNWDEVLLWIENKLKENSALKKTVIGKTYEHRDIFVLKVSTEQTVNKMSVFVVGGEEGRDWLSSAVLLNYIDKMLKSDNIPKSLLSFYDMYFIPILNPDGFVYTKQKDRMWAKNRKLIQPTQNCKNHKAVGVNIDKNWFYGKSESSLACNSIYIGSQALSEEETQSLSYILNSVALKLLAFINLKGFGNLIALPYADDEEISINHNIVMEIMEHASTVLKMQYNKSYPVGTTANYFYNLSGNMPDWVKRNLNTPIVFTVYMEHNKFLPNEFHILPITEQFESLLNITLFISKEIYGSLYNSQNKITSIYVLIISTYIIYITCIFF